MHRTYTVVMAATLALVCATPGTAGTKSPKLARCDGKSRRPANPNGSILPTVDPAAATVAPSGPTPPNVDVFPSEAPANPRPRAPGGGPAGDPPSPTPVPSIGAIVPQPSYRSC